MNEIELVAFLDSFAAKFGGKAEIQRFMQYDQFVHKPIRVPKILENKDLLNELFFTLRDSGLKKIVRTEKGCIARTLANTFGVWDYNIVLNSANNVIRGFIFTIVIFNRVYVIKAGRLTNAPKNTMSGSRAFSILKEELEKDGIKLEDYADENGKEFKAQIEKYPIENFIIHELIPHANHLDLNQAWPSALASKMPEFEKTFSRLDKSVLNSALGFCQSKYCQFKYSKLAMYGINLTNEIIYNMTAELVMQDFEIIGFNTDGIWYKDNTNKNRLYHDKNEGEGLHKWKNDIVDVDFYANSSGQYYIIKDGKYDFKLRGYYQYEIVKPRDQWNCHNDFQLAVSSVVELDFNEEDGIIVRRFYEE